MTSLLDRLPLCLCVLQVFVAVTHGDFVDLPPNQSILARAEEDTTLPCIYKPDQDNVVVQVTWYYTKKSDDTKEQIITAHNINGQTAFGAWSRRVRFKSNDPTSDSSLVIAGTEVSDEGKYVCHISTFPLGNFDTAMTLVVWTSPISSLDPVILIEGQSYGLAASCRSVARPPPRLSWETDLNGGSTNRSSDRGSVSTQFSLHPLRSMNGKKLDCLVWHPTLSGPRRLSNNLVVHFPPDPVVSGYSGDWYAGLENAALRCVSGGNPKPQSFTWTRKGGALPEGVIPHPNGTLAFGRPLSLSDGGTYQCLAQNEVGKTAAEVEINVAESKTQNLSEKTPMIIIIGAAGGGLLILMLVIIIAVTCHHRRKNHKLKKELTEKKEEINTLSRQASFRRMNSVSRGGTDEYIPLRAEGTLRTSMSSLGEQAQYRDSRSTLSGGRGGGGATLDYLGRPVLYNGSRRGRDRPLDRELEENQLRVETYVRNTSASLEPHLRAPLMPSPVLTLESAEIVRQMNGGAVTPAGGGGSRPGSVAKGHRLSPATCSYPEDEDEVDEGLGGPASQEHPDDQDSETNSSHVSEAPSTRYQQTNGTLRPKPTASPSDLSPHASLIHKAQIV